jgi:quercetin dioxygenase-like cupin family protein
MSCVTSISVIWRLTESVSEVYVVNAGSVEFEDLTKKDAAKVKVQYLIDERHGSNRFALRLYTVEKDGHTPLDQHEYEHQVFILEGEGLLRLQQGQIPLLRSLRSGDSVFIPSNAVHQFINESDRSLVFLCVKGNPALYGGKETKSASSRSNAC